MDEVKVEAHGKTLCLLSEFLTAISPYSFQITVLLFRFCHQDFKCLLIMELRFDMILYSNLVTTTLTLAISNVHAGRIWPMGRQFPTPDVK